MRECGKQDQESPRAARFMSQLLLMSVQILTFAALGGVVGGIGGLVGEFILSTEFRRQGTRLSGSWPGLGRSLARTSVYTSAACFCCSESTSGTGELLRPVHLESKAPNTFADALPGEAPIINHASCLPGWRSSRVESLDQ